MAILRTSTLNMSQEEWVEARSGSIGGSDAASVVNLNPYKSAFTLWAEKTGIIIPEDISQKESVRLGHYLEQYVAERFTEETGLKVRRENAILYNTDYPFAHACVDRMIIGQKAGLECKTTSALNLKKFKNGEYPATYYCQCMHYMAVTGYKVWYLAVLIGNSDLRIFKIERDEEEIAALMEAERQLWFCSETKTPPATDGSKSTSDSLAAAMPADPDAVDVDLTPMEEDIRQVVVLGAQIKALEAMRDAAANRIKSCMGSSVSGRCGGYSVKWSPVAINRFDRAAFQRKNPDVDITQYTKQSITRRFEIKEI